MTNSDQEQNTQGAPDGDVEADTASGGAPEPANSPLTDTVGPDPDLDPNDPAAADVPSENPSGG
jgi:hypothetical protein